MVINLTGVVATERGAAEVVLEVENVWDQTTNAIFAVPLIIFSRLVPRKSKQRVVQCNTTVPRMNLYCTSIY